MVTDEDVARFDLALRIANTCRAERGATVDEWPTDTDVAAWLDSAGLLASERAAELMRSTATARVVVDEARRAREAVRALFDHHARAAAPPEHVLFAINRLLDARRERLTLRAASGRPELTATERIRGPLGLLAPIALAAARLVTLVDDGRLRACAADACPRWFVDTSRGGRRRWCSMETCGNRAKAARHRRRSA